MGALHVVATQIVRARIAVVAVITIARARAHAVVARVLALINGAVGAREHMRTVGVDRARDRRRSRCAACTCAVAAPTLTEDRADDTGVAERVVGDGREHALARHATIGGARLLVVAVDVVVDLLTLMRGRVALERARRRAKRQPTVAVARAVFRRLCQHDADNE